MHLQTHDYVIKHLEEDFIVEEVFGLGHSLPIPQGEYSYFILKKKGYTTFQAIDEITSYFQLLKDSVGYAGLKDEDGVTTQTISIRGTLDPLLITKFNNTFCNQKNKSLKIDFVGNYANSIEISGLIGNCFTITIRNLDQIMLKNFSQHTDIFFINYYGGQRFGLPGNLKNTHEIGRAIIEKNFDHAIKLLSLQSSTEGKNAQLYQGGSEDYFSTLSKNLLGLYQSAYYSNKWNDQLIQTVKLLPGGYFKYILDGITLYFPRDPKDLLLLIADTGMTLENTRVIYKNNNFHSVHHPRLKLVQTKIHCLQLQADELFQKKSKVTVRFYLPLGSYATVAIHQYLQYIFDSNLRRHHAN